MKVAAYQAPLLAAGSMEAMELIRTRIRICEDEGVDILCCPEAVLGGLADDIENPLSIAIDTTGDQLTRELAPLASRSVTTIIGFTEVADEKLYNSAAVFHRGEVLGVYRKRHPAIRRSVYSPGSTSPIFRVAGLSFGIMLCNDSNFSELAIDMAARGAKLIFVPSNNGLRFEIADVVAATRAVDTARAKECNVMIVRADVAGKLNNKMSLGSSAIIDAGGRILGEGAQFKEGLLFAEITP